MRGIFSKIVSDLDIGRIVKRQAKKNKEVIYGAQAIKHQVFRPIARETVDYDVFSRLPRQSALQLEKSLDKNAIGDWFYTKPAMHKGTFKVMDKGQDGKQGTKDDFGVADYTQMPPKLRTRFINGVRFVKLSEVVKSKQQALRDPESEFRHEKDRDDLERIKIGRRFRRLTGL